MKNIIFTKTFDVPDEYAPVPSYKEIPDWYKDTESYYNNNKVPSGDGGTSASIKRCMPVFDALTSGYLLLTYTDIWVSQREQNPDKPGVKEPWYEWPSLGPIAFHPVWQASKHPDSQDISVPKLVNPWSIKTPPGYSTLFIPPVHRKNIFVAFPGVVDTDVYTAPVNIVFTLSNRNFEGLIPAGTPIVQVIPFKRDAWEMSFGKEKDRESQNKVALKLKTKFFDSYKTLFRQKKDYK